VARVTLLWMVLLAAAASVVFVVVISREMPSAPHEAGWVVRRAGGLVQRVRTKLPDGVTDTDAYPQAVTMTWTYAGNMPEKQDVARLDRFEDALEAIEDADLGYLMFVTTGEGRRTWSWFVRDAREFMNDVRAIDDAGPVAFATADDPKWDAYTRMRRSMM
jgi:hypothetical protein